ncbi:MAG: hypothetical protein ACI4V1_00955 [Eubacteriales bacterium]
MLLKLLRHDFASSRRFGIPVLIAIAAATLLGSLNVFVTVNSSGFNDTPLFSAEQPIGEFLIFASMGGLVLISFALAAAASVMAILLLVQFYRSTVSDEAYLTFTLPVTPAQILWAKLLNVTFWSILTGIALLLSAACIIGTGVAAAGIGEDFVNMFVQLFAFIGSISNSGVLMFLLLCLCGAAMFVSTYLMLFMAITFGSVIARRHKALAAVAMVFGIHFVMNGITSMLQFTLLGSFTLQTMLEGGSVSVNLFLGTNVLLYTVLAVVYFLLTNFMLEKKLNLD